MHGDGCLSRTGYTLYNDIGLWRTPDNQILFFLNRCNDLTEHRLLVFRQILCQKFIICHHIGIKKIFQMIIFNLIRAFLFQVNRKGSLRTDGILTWPQTTLIIYRCNRCSPVQYDRFRVIFCNSHSSDIVRLVPFYIRIFEINSSKIRFPARFLITHQIILIFLQTRGCIIPQRQAFLILCLIHVQQVFQILVHFPDICSGAFKILLCNPDNLLQFLFFGLPRQSRKHVFLFQMYYPPVIYRMFERHRFRNRRVRENVPASFFCAPIRIVISCSGRFAKYAPSQPSQPYSPFTQIPCCNSGATHLRIKFA